MPWTPEILANLTSQYLGKVGRFTTRRKRHYGRGALGKVGMPLSAVLGLGLLGNVGIPLAYEIA